ncbi:MAG: hypothetical protein C5B51_00730 [Terriglobia bacterium]|nr:MAG: hypothetical protein C5B51_00730 [Terriglobia bacterium]
MLASDKNSKLYVKSYFAQSIEAAIEQAHAELGPDALLLNSREAPPEAKHQGAYEVVFGCKPASSGAPAEMQRDPVDDLRRKMDEIRDMVARIGVAHAAPAGSVADALLAAGVDPVLAVEIEIAVQHRLRNQSVIEMGRLKSGNWPPADVMRETAAELESRFDIDPVIGRITALIGPPGAGKTTCLVKLAVTQGLAARRAVRLISTDNYRIAAAAQLQTYAEVLGVPFTLAETPAALAQAIDAAPNDALVLIDTPGYSAASLAESGFDLAAFLRNRQDIDTHLVLTASMRLADLRRIVDRFEAFHPAKLLFTRLDEAESSAAMFCEAARTRKPLSFFGTGQLVPEDLEPARKETITRLLARELPQPCEAVA